MMVNHNNITTDKYVHISIKITPTHKLLKSPHLAIVQAIWLRTHNNRTPEHVWYHLVRRYSTYYSGKVVVYEVSIRDLEDRWVNVET